jgi:hypothetical protein
MTRADLREFLAGIGLAWLACLAAAFVVGLVLGVLTPLP